MIVVIIHFQWSDKNCLSLVREKIMSLYHLPRKPFPSLAGVSTHPFLLNSGTSGKVNILPLGHFN